MDPVEFDFVGADSIVVWDWELGRLALFGPDGLHARSVMLRPPVANPTGRVGALGREGIVLGSHDYRPPGTQLTPQFLEVLRYDWDGSLLDKPATLPYGEMGWVDRESRMGGRPLFQSRGVFSTHGDLLYTSDGSSPEVRIHRGERLESILRWEPGDLTARREDVEAYRSIPRAARGSGPSPARVRPTPSGWALRRQARSSAACPCQGRSRSFASTLRRLLVCTGTRWTSNRSW